MVVTVSEIPSVDVPRIPNAGLRMRESSAVSVPWPAMVSAGSARRPGRSGVTVIVAARVDVPAREGVTSW